MSNQASNINHPQNSQSSQASSTQKSNLPYDFFSQLFAATPVNPHQFVEKENGLFEMAQEEPSETVQNDRQEDVKTEQKRNLTTKESVKNQSEETPVTSYHLDDLIKLDVPIMDRQHAYLSHIYKMAQDYIQKATKTESPAPQLRYVFKTELGPDEALDIQVQKSMKNLNVALYADGDLQAFLLDKLIALKKHLKKLNPEFEDIEIEVIDREQQNVSDKPYILRQNISFSPFSPSKQTGSTL